MQWLQLASTVLACVWEGAAIRASCGAINGCIYKRAVLAVVGVWHERFRWCCNSGGHPLGLYLNRGLRECFTCVPTHSTHYSLSGCKVWD